MILGVTRFVELEYDVRKLVCNCAISVYGPYPPMKIEVGYIPLCSICVKPRLHYAYLCEICEDYFIKDFKHPGFCYREPQCWDCLTDDAYCNHCMSHLSDIKRAMEEVKRPPRIRKKAQKEVTFQVAHF